MKKKKKKSTLCGHKPSYLSYFVGRYGFARSCHMNVIFKIKNMIFDPDFDRLYAECYKFESSDCLIELIFNRRISYHPFVGGGDLPSVRLVEFC